jgi:hypothetical protein
VNAGDWITQHEAAREESFASSGAIQFALGTRLTSSRLSSPRKRYNCCTFCAHRYAVWCPADGESAQVNDCKAAAKKMERTVKGRKPRQ